MFFLTPWRSRYRTGWTIVGAYTDVISGAREQRPGLARLLADAHCRPFDLRLLWTRDRLGHSLCRVVEVMDALFSREAKTQREG